MRVKYYPRDYDKITLKPLESLESFYKLEGCLSQKTFKQTSLERPHFVSVFKCHSRSEEVPTPIFILTEDRRPKTSFLKIVNLVSSTFVSLGKFKHPLWTVYPVRDRKGLFVKKCRSQFVLIVLYPHFNCKLEVLGNRK